MIKKVFSKKNIDTIKTAAEQDSQTGEMTTAKSTIIQDTLFIEVK